jgi:hypothetical protein
MSLESKIDLLIKAVNEQTTAINAFNGNIEKWLTTPTVEVTEEKAQPEQQQEVTSEPVQDELKGDEPYATLTHKDVQDAVLAFVRQDVKVNKPLVKALLDEFEAKKVSDVSESKLEEFNTKLGAL